MNQFQISIKLCWNLFLLKFSGFLLIVDNLLYTIFENKYGSVEASTLREINPVINLQMFYYVLRENHQVLHEHTTVSFFLFIQNIFKQMKEIK
jgi:hypothetical protein